MLFKNEIHTGSVFGESNIVMENTLKNPNQFKEAVIYNSLASMPSNKIREFVASEEAKFMIKEGIIKQDCIDRLCTKQNNAIADTAVCHIAKEENDPLWNQFVAARIEERRIMNELIEKYGKQAADMAAKAYDDFIVPNVPEYFRED